MSDQKAAPEVTGLQRCLPPATLLGIFALSRLVFRSVGIKFDSAPLLFFYQYLDVYVLKSELATSLWYLHAQPPLFNAFLGTILKFEDPATIRALFASCYLGFGLLLFASIYLLLVRLGTSRWCAAIVTAVFACSPVAILYENLLFYTYPVTAVLAAAALAAHRFASTRSFGSGFVFYGLLGICVGTRSLFHLGWLFLWVLIPLVSFKGQRRRVLAAACLSLLLCTGLYVKNWVLFRVPGASSWLGMSLAKSVITPAEMELREAMVADGLLSDLSLYEPFRELDHYPPRYRSAQGPEVDVLRQALRFGGGVNFNHQAYIAISDGFFADAITMTVHHPEIYFQTLAKAWRLSLLSPTEYLYVTPNKEHIALYDTLFRRVIYVEVGGVCIAWVVLLIPALILGLKAGLGTFGAALRDPEDQARALALLFLATTIVYVIVLGNAVEFGENQRFRVMVEPLALVLIVWMLPRLKGLRSAARL